jgi:hypothetical protein
MHKMLVSVRHELLQFQVIIGMNVSHVIGYEPASGHLFLECHVCAVNTDNALFMSKHQ